MKRLSKVTITKIETNIDIPWTDLAHDLARGVASLFACHTGEYRDRCRARAERRDDDMGRAQAGGSRSYHVRQRAVRYGWERGAPVKIRTYKL